jgi:beta-lactamase class A
MKRVDGFLLVALSFLCSSLGASGDGPHPQEAGYFVIGPFSLDQLVDASSKEALSEIANGAKPADLRSALAKCHVYLLNKRIRTQAGHLGFDHYAGGLVFEGKSYFEFKDSAGRPFQINLLRMWMGSDNFDNTTDPATCRSLISFEFRTKHTLALNVVRTRTLANTPPDFRYNSNGKLIEAPLKAGAPRPGSLTDRVMAVTAPHKGKVSIAAKHLATGEVFLFNADEVMPTASLIKLPVMIEVYQQASSSRFGLTDMLTLRDKDKVPGSGILSYHFSDGASFSIRDAVRLMIAYSDNTATNMLLDKIGIASTGKHMEKWGFPNTKINAKVYLGKTTSIDPEATKKYGLGSTTAREMVGILEKLHQGKFVSPDACKQMIEHLKNCQFKDQIKRFLPPETVVAHKTGAVSGIRTDAGIMYLKSGPVALCILTADNADKRWSPDNEGNVLWGRIAKEVYDYFSAATKK